MIFKFITKDLFFFALAGFIGFIVDAGVLYAVKDIFGNYLGRVLSFLCAVFVTWLINRNIVFRHRKSGVALNVEFGRYLFVMLGGGSINYIVYAVLVSCISLVEAQPVLGVAVGSIVGMLVNYIYAKKIVFTQSRTQSN